MDQTMTFTYSRRKLRAESYEYGVNQSDRILLMCLFGSSHTYNMQLDVPV